VPRPDALSQLLERRQRVGSPVLIHDGTGGLPLPVCSLEEVDEVDPEGLFGLAHLPLLTCTLAFQLLAKPAHLVRQGLVCGRPSEELAHPADAVRRRARLHQLRFQNELAKLLQRRFQLTHDSPRWRPVATVMPS
jgi:hypothetical protein